MNVTISIPQMDQLNNIKAGLESVVWMCYLAFYESDESDNATKTASSIYLLLEPWYSRLGDVLEELEEARRECKEREGRKKE